MLQLANIHGDITVQQPLDTTVASTVQRYDEYGNALDGTVATAYGWLGVHQRATNTVGGHTLMGARVYDATTGRFLQTDPILDGSPNHYGYPADPVTGYDLDGKGWKWKVSKKLTDKKARKIGKALSRGGTSLSVYATTLVPSGYGALLAAAVSAIGLSVKSFGIALIVAAAAPKPKVKITIGIKVSWGWLYYPWMTIKPSR